MFSCILNNRNYCSYYQYLYYYNSISINTTCNRKNNTCKKKLTTIKEVISKLKITISLNNKRSDITIVVTSCMRIDLLNQSIRSLMKFNTYPINKLVIVEDSEITTSYTINKKVIEKKQNNYYVNVIKNSLNIKQNKSVDRVYSQIKTKYIFHSEDDWRYYRFSFIEKSKSLFEIYEKCSLNKKVLQIWLRNYKEMVNMAYFHWYTKNVKYNNFKYNKVFSNSEWWNGFSFNPGLKKSGDYIKNNEYGKFSGLNKHFESEIGIYYNKYKYEVLSIENLGYIDHLGWGRHINNLNEVHSYSLIYKKREEKIYINNYKYKKIQIPFITHRIWIFDKRKTFINENIVKIILYSIKKISNNINMLWRHFFWTNFPELLIKLMSDSNYLTLLNYTVITSPNFLIKYNLGILCNKTKYISFSEICKKVIPSIILEKYGGIYINAKCKINFYLVDLHYLFNFFIPIDKRKVVYIDILGSIKKHLYHKYFQQHIIKFILSKEEENINSKSSHISIYYDKTFFKRNKFEFYIPYESISNVLRKQRCIVTINNRKLLLKICSIGTIVLSDYKLMSKIKYNIKNILFIKEYVKHYYKIRKYIPKTVIRNLDKRKYNIIINNMRNIFFPKNILLKDFKNKNYFHYIEQEEKNNISLNLLSKININDNYVEYSINCNEHIYLLSRKVIKSIKMNIITNCNNYNLIELSLLEKNFVFENINSLEINMNKSLNLLKNNYTYEILYYIIDLNEISILSDNFSLNYFLQKIFIRSQGIKNFNELNNINKYWEKVKVLEYKNLNEYLLDNEIINYNILRLNNLELECNLLKNIDNNEFDKPSILSMNYNVIHNNYIEEDLKLHSCLNFINEKNYFIYILNNYKIEFMNNSFELMTSGVEIIAINQLDEFSLINEI